ncbi:MAG TPA: hypothetical protein VN841_14990 [Bryobacteraceae bacterium]|nr:hypothetical protein [Bryobacteraceae bacterium]
MVISPSVPKPGSGLPVRAFKPIILCPVVNRMRGGLLRSPGQYAKPRCEATPDLRS